MIKKSPLYIQSKNNYIRKRTTVNCRETNTYISGKEDLYDKRIFSLVKLSTDRKINAYITIRRYV